MSKFKIGDEVYFSHHGKDGCIYEIKNIYEFEGKTLLDIGHHILYDVERFSKKENSKKPRVLNFIGYMAESVSEKGDLYSCVELELGYRCSSIIPPSSLWSKCSDLVSKWEITMKEII